MPSIHPANLAIVAVVALVVLGPEKLPGTVRTMGRLWADFQRARQGFEQQLRDGFGVAPANSSLSSWKSSVLSGTSRLGLVDGKEMAQSSTPVAEVERPLWLVQTPRKVPRSYLGTGPLVVSAEERSLELGAPSSN